MKTSMNTIVGVRTTSSLRGDALPRIVSSHHDPGHAEQGPEADCQAISGLNHMSEKKKSKASRRYAVCISNKGNEASLERNKLYVLLPDRQAEADGLVRVIDEDGEDYLYPADWFVAVQVPKAVQASLLKAS